MKKFKVGDEITFLDAMGMATPTAHGDKGIVVKEENPQGYIRCRITSGVYLNQVVTRRIDEIELVIPSPECVYSAGQTPEVGDKIFWRFSCPPRHKYTVLEVSESGERIRVSWNNMPAGAEQDWSEVRRFSLYERAEKSGTTNMKEFKVNDKVEFIKDASYTPAGSTGTIVSCGDNDCIGCRIDTSSISRSIGQIVYRAAQELKLIEELIEEPAVSLATPTVARDEFMIAVIGFKHIIHCAEQVLNTSVEGLDSLATDIPAITQTLEVGCRMIRELALKRKEEKK